eukprot:TRINITY_DN7696_c0_g3_i1.p2 TRINITY_DN7696_c0_g3~~TRINITY_DN7696_c0_g3_i1.p2  ORF type:complete len:214 (-),score=-0.78 TRINITY_DN7696_c0_g3_i1:133-774(-)
MINSRLYGNVPNIHKLQDTKFLLRLIFTILLFFSGSRKSDFPDGLFQELSRLKMINGKKLLRKIRFWKKSQNQVFEKNCKRYKFPVLLHQVIYLKSTEFFNQFLWITCKKCLGFGANLEHLSRKLKFRITSNDSLSPDRKSHSQKKKYQKSGQKKDKLLLDLFELTNKKIQNQNLPSNITYCLSKTQYSKLSISPWDQQIFKKKIELLNNSNC